MYLFTDPKPRFNCETWILSSLAAGCALLLILLIVTILYCNRKSNPHLLNHTKCSRWCYYFIFKWFKSFRTYKLLHIVTAWLEHRHLKHIHNYTNHTCAKSIFFLVWKTIMHTCKWFSILLHNYLEDMSEQLNYS